jgi:acyl carrier protein
VPSQAAFERELRSFVEGLAKRPVRVNSRLFERDYIDSLKVLDLISFLESRLDIQIRDEQITLGNFRSIRVIADAFWRHRR